MHVFGQIQTGKHEKSVTIPPITGPLFYPGCFVVHALTALGKDPSGSDVTTKNIQ